MKHFIKIVILLFLTFSLFTCGTNQKPVSKNGLADLTEIKFFDIKIRQNNQNINESAGIYNIADNKFEILVSNKNNNIISIFAYHSGEMFNKYSYPVKCQDTVIFHPATSLINDADENREITLYINREMQFNAITEEKRKDENGISIIKIKDIADTDDRFSGTLYLTIFIDFNNNNIIESNEINNISVAINRKGNSGLFRARIYVSTMGGWNRDINYPVYGNEYFYVKITSEAELERFLELFGREYGVNTYSTINRVRNLDYLRRNMYILFTPITTEIEFYNNPYRYAGENRLIFETRINKNSNKGRYVFYREYHVDKTKDIYEIWINVNGSLRRANELKLN